MAVQFNANALSGCSRSRVSPTTSKSSSRAAVTPSGEEKPSTTPGPAVSATSFRCNLSVTDFEGFYGKQVDGLRLGEML